MVKEFESITVLNSQDLLRCDDWKIAESNVHMKLQCRLNSEARELLGNSLEIFLQSNFFETWRYEHS